MYNNLITERINEDSTKSFMVKHLCKNLNNELAQKICRLEDKLTISKDLNSKLNSATNASNIEIIKLRKKLSTSENIVTKLLRVECQNSKLKREIVRLKSLQEASQLRQTTEINSRQQMQLSNARENALADQQLFTCNLDLERARKECEKLRNDLEASQCKNAELTNELSSTNEKMNIYQHNLSGQFKSANAPVCDLGAKHNDVKQIEQLKVVNGALGKALNAHKQNQISLVAAEHENFHLNNKLILLENDNAELSKKLAEADIDFCKTLNVLRGELEINKCQNDELRRTVKISNEAKNSLENALNITKHQHLEALKRNQQLQEKHIQAITLLERKKLESVSVYCSKLNADQEVITALRSELDAANKKMKEPCTEQLWNSLKTVDGLLYKLMNSGPCSCEEREELKKYSSNLLTSICIRYINLQKKLREERVERNKSAYMLELGLSAPLPPWVEELIGEYKVKLRRLNIDLAKLQNRNKKVDKKAISEQSANSRAKRRSRRRT